MTENLDTKFVFTAMKPVIRKVTQASPSLPEEEKMRETLAPLVLMLCFTLGAANRVYVHPFSLFAYDNFSCEVILAQAQKPLEMVKPTPIDHQGSAEPDLHTHKGVAGSKEKMEQKVAILAMLQNTLGVRFYHTLTQQKATNAVFSPVNAFGTLVIFYMGASNATAEKLQQLLGLSADGKTKHCVPFFDGHKVLRTQQRIKSLVDASSDELRTRVWTFVNSGTDLSQEFMRNMQDVSDASYIRSVDFSKPEEAEAQVSSFLQKTSSGNTKDLFKDISPSMNLLFLSSVHFKGNWGTAFKTEAESLQKFWIDEETSVEVPFISHTGNFKYLNNKVGRHTIIELPLGKKTSMLLVVAHEGSSLEHITANLNTDIISQWRQQLSEGFLEVSLPKLSVSFVSNLKESLSSMKLAFLLGEQADFGRLSNKHNLTLDKVLNNVVFEMSEGGADNQAVLEDGRVALKLTINRPFFFAMVEGKSDAILLLGWITNPTQ
ncbi:angiotensinogen [Arapaima gigas]